MLITIFAGVMLIATPFIMNMIFPPQESQIAVGQRARLALSDWFVIEPDELADVQAYRQESKDGQSRRMYFTWSTKPSNVRAFIRRKKLEQKDMTDEVMQSVFANDNIVWWQPQALERESWFTGKDGQANLNLIYNDDTRRGVMVVIHDQ